MFLEKYGSMSLYDEDLDKRCIIDHEQLQFDKNSGWTLIGIPEKPGITLLYNEFFWIHDDIFDRSQSTHQDNNIMLKFISNEPNENESQCEVTKIFDDKIHKKKSNINNKWTKHTLQRKRQKFSADYRKKSFYDFKIIILYPTPELDSEESNILSSYFGISNENQSNKVISKMVLTNILKRW